MRVVVFGLWHLGCVTAACLAASGNQVVGLDLDEQVVAELQRGKLPIHEPGLSELVAEDVKSTQLSFTSDASIALRDADVLWVTFDTPVNERDEADVAFVRAQLDAIADAIQPATLVLISSQVPVGFTRALEQAWHDKQLHYAVSPENLRLGKAIEVFRNAERVIIGVRDEHDKDQLSTLFAPYTQHIEWMSVESAEMTKHALNAFLATSVTFINELARLCEVLGADAKEVERGLKSEARIGSRAYLAPGAAFAGGTLARDVRFLVGFGQQQHLATPLFDGVLASNDVHKNWVHAKITQLLRGVDRPVVAVLGLTYKPGTDTLRRSMAVELCHWLGAQDVHVQVFDPVVHNLPKDLQSIVTLADSAADALVGADVAVIATEWPDFRSLVIEPFLAMRRPQVIDQNRFLVSTLGADARVSYTAIGAPLLSNH